MAFRWCQFLLFGRKNEYQRAWNRTRHGGDENRIDQGYPYKCPTPALRIIHVFGS